MDINNYLYGECHIFALALHNKFGYQIQFAIDECDLEIEKEVLIHAYCMNNNKAVDIRGFVNLEELLNEYDYNKPYFKNVTKDELEKLMEKGFVHKPKEKQLQEIEEYLEDNIDKYK